MTIRTPHSPLRTRAELAIFLLALSLRLAWVGLIQLRGGELFGPDALSYDQLAVSLLEGKGLAKWDYQGLFSDPGRALVVRSFRPPLLPVLLAGVYGVAGHHFWVARVAMALLSAATCVVVARIARRLFGATAGAVAGLLAAVYPKLIYYGGQIATETPYTLLLALAVATLLTAQRDDWSLWRWPAAGALMGLATLCRSALLAFAPWVCVWTLLVRPRKRRALGEAALVAAGFAAVMAPWWGRNLALHGRFVPATTEGGYTLWVTNNERADGGGKCFWPDDRAAFDGLSEVEIDHKFARMGWDYIRAHHRRFVELAGAKFVRFWRLWPHAEEPSVGVAAAVVAGLSFTPVLLLALWGAIAARRQWRDLSLIYLLILYYTLLHMVLMAITRYRLPIEPFLIILAAHGILEIVRRLRAAATPEQCGMRNAECGMQARERASGEPRGATSSLHNLQSAIRNPQSGSPFLSVIIPTYNEEANIGRTAEAALAWLRGRDFDWELLLVDDGSTDATPDIERELAERDVRVRLLAFSPNRGKGHAVRQGMLAAQGAVRLFLDADYSTPLDEADRLLPHLAAGCDVAIGTRRTPDARIEGKPPAHRHILGELYVALARRLLGCSVSDFNCGFKAFRAEAAQRLFALARRDDWSFDAEVLALAERCGYRIAEEPVRWAHVQATSKVRPLRDGFRSLRALLAIRRDLRRGRYQGVNC